MPTIPDIIARTEGPHFKRDVLVAAMEQFIAETGYTIKERTIDKPWGLAFDFAAKKPMSFSKNFSLVLIQQRLEEVS
jgi:hypothetical protein